MLMRFFRNSVVIFFLGVIASSIIFEAIFAVFEKVSVAMAPAEKVPAVNDGFSRVERNAKNGVAALAPLAVANLFLEALDDPPHPIPWVALDKKTHKMSPTFEPNRTTRESQLGVRLGYWVSRLGVNSIKWPIIYFAVAPVIALADLIWHLLVSGYVIARIMILAQLALGAVLTLFLMNWAEQHRKAIPTFWVFGCLALGTILFASASAYAMGFIMTAANELFIRLTQIGGTAASLGTTVFGIGFFHESGHAALHKWSEKVLEKVLTKLC